MGTNPIAPVDLSRIHLVLQLFGINSTPVVDDSGQTSTTQRQWYDGGCRYTVSLDTATGRMEVSLAIGLTDPSTLTARHLRKDAGLPDDEMCDHFTDYRNSEMPVVVTTIDRERREIGLATFVFLPCGASDKQLHQLLDLMLGELAAQVDDIEMESGDGVSAITQPDNTAQPPAEPDYPSTAAADDDIQLIGSRRLIEAVNATGLIDPRDVDKAVEDHIVSDDGQLLEDLSNEATALYATMHNFPDDYYVSTDSIAFRVPSGNCDRRQLRKIAAECVKRYGVACYTTVRHHFPTEGSSVDLFGAKPELYSLHVSIGSYWPKTGMSDTQLKEYLAGIVKAHADVRADFLKSDWARSFGDKVLQQNIDDVL